MEQKTRVYIVSGYMGNPKIGVYADDKEYVIDTDYLKEYIKEQILSKGYTIEKTNRQKYPRLKINN